MTIAQEEAPHLTTVISLDAARSPRFYLAVANANEAWRPTKASMALSGMEATDDDAERAGRLIVGAATADRIAQELSDKYANKP